MRAFYDGLNQVDKLLKLSRNSATLNFLGAGDKAIKLFSCLIVMRALRNGPNEIHCIPGP